MVMFSFDTCMFYSSITSGFKCINPFKIQFHGPGVSSLFRTQLVFFGSRYIYHGVELHFLKHKKNTISLEDFFGSTIKPGEVGKSLNPLISIIDKKI